MQRFSWSLICIFLIVLLLNTCIAVHAQPNKRTNFWFWADELGLDFNSGSPVENTSCPFAGQGWGATATMSDTNGNLLFYSMGDSVYNKNHQASPLSWGCYNWDQGAQSAISLPVPGSDSLYYIFTARMHREPNPMIYYIIDMSLNNGLGEIIDIDTLAAGYDAADQIQAVYLKNKEDYWIITRKYHEDKFAAFLVTSEGVNPDPVLSPAPNKDYLGNDRMGFLKVSYDKKYMVACFRPDVELYKFDVETGNIEYLSKFRLRDLILNGPAYTTYNCDFSPCSKYMYLGGTLHADSNTHVFQMDMQYIEDSVLFEQSIVEVGSGQGKHLQLASDGKIYLFFRSAAFVPPNPINQYVGVIHDPGKHGLACNHQANIFHFTHGQFTSSFVNFAIDFLFRFDFDGICESDTFTFDPWFFPEPDLIRWDFGDPASGINNNISTIPHATHKFSDGGIYEVSVHVEYPNGRIEETSRKVEVEYAPEPDLGPDTTICSGAEFILDAACGPHHYSWSTGAFGTPQITVSDSGWYWVRVRNDAGCIGTDSIYIAFYPPSVIDTTQLQIIPTTCGGNMGVIKGLEASGTSPFTYLWTNDAGDTISHSQDIYHLSVWNYTLHVTDGNGCTTASGPYTIHDAGDVLIESVVFSHEHCGQQDGSIIVSAVSGLNDMLFYSIDNGASYLANQGIFDNLPAGSYAIRVRDSSNCQDVYAQNPLILENIPGPQIDQVNITPSLAGQNNGAIEIQASSPCDTLYYSNDNGSTFQVNDGWFPNLSPGFYTCLVQDEFGCDTTFTIEVTEEITLRLQAIAGDDEVCPGNTAFVPLTVTNFQNVATFRANLLFNNNLLQCQGYANTHAALEDSLQAVVFPAEGRVEITWASDPLTLAQQSTMTELVFASVDPGTSLVDWDGQPGMGYFRNAQGVDLPVDYHTGEVKIYNHVSFILEPQKEACQGEDIVLTPQLQSSNGEVSYLWTFPSGDTGSQMIQHIEDAQPQQSGIYHLLVTDTAQCQAEAGIQVTVYENPHPEISPQDTLTTEEPVEIDAGSGYPSYLWNTGETTQHITADTQGWYRVVVASMQGCTGEDSVFVLFLTPPPPPPPPIEPQSDLIFLPNAFSPNGDGLNDIFKAKTSSDNITHFHLLIYNRWGGLVFESKNITIGWDGQHNGQPAPEGTYVYRVEYAVGGGENREVDGMVVLVR